MIIYKATAVLLALVVSQQANAVEALSPSARAQFREAVEDYQMAVVPHCTPDLVEAYVAARADRDRAFVQSLRNTPLAADYRQAVADRAKKDRSTVYECMGPPPPPPPPPGWVPPPSVPSQPVVEKDPQADHFAAGDRDFEEMVQLRDALIGAPNN